MKSLLLATAAFAIAIALPASAADDAALTRMALCQDSWIEWTKNEPKSFEGFRAHFMEQFAMPRENKPNWMPKANVTVLGMHVAEAFPDSVGMGVGFSLMVDAPYDAARAALEKATGKKLQHCEASDGSRGCELEVAPQRTITLEAEDNPKSRQSLIGCYYFYEK